MGSTEFANLALHINHNKESAMGIGSTEFANLFVIRSYIKVLY